MRAEKDILEIEEKYKKLLTDKLKGDARLSLSCPNFRYPEPLFFYVKAKKTEKTIAIRIDGGDGTMRFWDYVDDDYTNEDGVWANMTERGLETLVTKLYKVMNCAVDIEFYDRSGETDDYYSGVAACELTVENARKLIKKHSENIKFVFARVSNFFGTVTYIFNHKLECIRGGGDDDDSSN